MKKLLTAFLAFTLMTAPAVLAQQPEDEESNVPPVPVMMDLVRTLMQMSRDGRLEQMMPRADQLRGLETILRPDGQGYGLAEELLRAVKPSPEQEQAMRGFHLEQDQVYAMLDYVMDHGRSTRPEDMDQFLTRDQQDVIDNLQLSNDQISSLETLLSQAVIPMMDQLQSRTDNVRTVFDPQNGLLQMLMQMIPQSNRD